MKRHPIRYLIVLLGCLAAADLAAAPIKKGGSDCLVGTDFYIVHFNAFQPPAEIPTGAREKRQALQRFCQRLPRTGTTYFGIDFIDRDVRSLPISLSVVEEREEDGSAMKTLKTVPSQLYPHGVAELKVDFDHPGRYALIIQFGEETGLSDDRLRIPLTVGLGGDSIPWLKVAAIFSLLAFFTMVIFFFVRFKNGEVAT